VTLSVNSTRVISPTKNLPKYPESVPKMSYKLSMIIPKTYQLLGRGTYCHKRLCSSCSDGGYDAQKQDQLVLPIGIAINGSQLDFDCGLSNLGGQELLLILGNESRALSLLLCC